MACTQLRVVLRLRKRFDVKVKALFAEADLNGSGVLELEEAFQFVEEFPEVIQSGMWVSNDCFVFSNIKG